MTVVATIDEMTRALYIWGVWYGLIASYWFWCLAHGWPGDPTEAVLWCIVLAAAPTFVTYLVHVAWRILEDTL